jgi:hypothetical protein
VKLKIPAVSPVMLVAVTSALPAPFQVRGNTDSALKVIDSEALESACTTAWAGCAAARKRLEIASRSAPRDAERHR